MYAHADHWQVYRLWTKYRTAIIANVVLDIDLNIGYVILFSRYSAHINQHIYIYTYIYIYNAVSYRWCSIQHKLFYPKVLIQTLSAHTNALG